jgi:hypothetical protein
MTHIPQIKVSSGSGTDLNPRAELLTRMTIILNRMQRTGLRGGVAKPAEMGPLGAR